MSTVEVDPKLAEHIEHGDLDKIKQLVDDKTCEWNTSCTCLAAFYGHVDLVKYAYDIGTEWDCSVCEDAAFGNKNALEIIQFAHQHGCEMNLKVAHRAIKHNNLELLSYYINTGGELNRECVHVAVLSMNLISLKYLHDKGYKMGHYDVFCSIYNDFEDGFKFALDNDINFNSYDVWTYFNSIYSLVFIRRITYLRWMIEANKDCPAGEFSALIKKFNNTLSLDLLDKHIWLRQYLFSKLHLIPKDELPMIHRLYEHIELSKQYAYVETNSLPNHVIRYVICSYF